MSGRAGQHQRDLDRLLRRQAGVISLAQAAELGIDRAAVRRRVAAGRWRRVAPRVYQVGDHPETPTSRVISAMVSLGDGATLVGRSAAWWWRLSSSFPARVEVAVDPTRAPRERLEVDLVRRPIAAADRTTLRGVAITTKPLTVLDACARLGLIEGARLMDDALGRNAVTLGALREAQQRNLGRRGTELARQLLALAAGGARSEAERLSHQVLRVAGLSGWTANTTITIPGYGRAVADIVFSDLGVVVEVDGWSCHRTRRAFRRDQARQNALVVAKWTVVRTNWYELTEEPEVFVANVRAALAEKIRNL